MKPHWEEGWLEEMADDEHPAGISGRERFYRITRVGRTALEREAARLESLAHVAPQRGWSSYAAYNHWSRISPALMALRRMRPSHT